jgi:hypothetical protein
MKTFIFLSEISDRKHIEIDTLEKIKLACFAVAYPVMLTLAVLKIIY